MYLERSYRVMNENQESLSLLKQNLQLTKTFTQERKNNNKQQLMRTQKTELL